MISVAIIARDEERHLGDAIRSAASVAGETLVVLDPRTTDRTRAIAEAHGARVVDEPFRSHAAQRNRALEHCRGAWVLFLDADERLTAELADEIGRLERDGALSQAGRSGYQGYTIPRFNLYWGRRLRGGGWYPDRQLRLVRRDAAHYDEQRLIHELAEVEGSVGELRGHLLHINIESWAELRRKQYLYAIKEAETLYLTGTRAQPRNLLLQPPREVWRRFWTWQGYRDGGLGLLLALTMGYYEAVKYRHLMALGRSERPSASS